jgi:hypothetical protein
VLAVFLLFHPFAALLSRCVTSKFEAQEYGFADS